MRLTPLALAAAAALPLAACVAVQKDTSVRAQLADYAYPLPPEEVWPGVTGLLKEHGYPFVEDPSTFVLATDWKEEMGGSEVSGVWTRYLVQGTRLDDDRSAIRFLRESKTAHDEKRHQAGLGDNGNAPAKEFLESREGYEGTSASTLSYLSQNNAGSLKRGAVDATHQGLTRDFHMEWLLLQRLAPEHARALEGQASRR